MYTIGEFAKLINKSVKTLQHWDKIDKLKSTRSSTNRRYYTEEDLEKYVDIKSINQQKILINKINELILKISELINETNKENKT
jgi:DNA-binding transcriptional MerR regulator